MPKWTRAIERGGVKGPSGRNYRWRFLGGIRGSVWTLITKYREKKVGNPFVPLSRQLVTFLGRMKYEEDLGCFGRLGKSPKPHAAA